MKKINLLSIFLFLSPALFAQFSVNWDKQYQATTSPNYSNEGRKVVTDANSNVFMLGDYSSNLDSSGHNAGSTQYSVRLLKFDYTGTLQYWRFFNVGGLINNGFDNRSAFGLQVDAAGNVYIGYSVLNSFGNLDVVLQKFSNSLSTIWTYTYSTTKDDIGVKMVLNNNAAVAVVKSYNANTTLYSLISGKSTATISTPLCSFDPNQDVVNSILMNGSKTMYVTGSRLISGAKTVMTAAVSSTGSIKWKSTFNNGTASGDDYGNDLVLGSDGYLEVVGTIFSGGANGTDGAVMRYSISGALQSFIPLNQSATDLGTSIANGPAGFVFAGCSNTTKITVYKIQLGSQIAVNTSTSYSPVPTVPYTGITGVSIGDMKVAASNNVYLCGTVNATSASGNLSGSFLAKVGFLGFFYRTLNFQPVDGQFSANCSSVCLGLDGYKSDILVLRNLWANNSNHASETVEIMDYDGGTSLRLANSNASTVNSDAEVLLYPNPASDNFTVTSSSDDIRAIEISDLTGKVARTINVNSAEAKISVSDLNKGLYFCRIVTASGKLVIKKLIIE